MASRNVISGNAHRGVWIDGGSTTGNFVVGNYIGVDPSSSNGLGNGWEGVTISGAADNNTIGGSTRTERNIISDNGTEGVLLDGTGVISNTVSGNWIGLAANGTTGLGNGWSGVTISNGADQNIIGGATAGHRNIIADNTRSGVLLHLTGPLGNTVSANYIGTTHTGNGPKGNDESGITINNSPNNMIGGDTADEGNVISANQYHGIEILNSGSISNTVSGNYIGLGVDGDTDIGNNLSGIRVYAGAGGTLIGGGGAGSMNVISGNDVSGIQVLGPGTSNVQILGNVIGTDAGGTLDRGNNEAGVYISGGAQLVTVGGTETGERNLISGNNVVGVSISGSGTISNTVSGNFIGTDYDGTLAIPNNDGVFVGQGASYNTIGVWNLISGNSGDGVEVYGVGSEYNTIIGNYIGTDDSGTGDLGNTSSGVKIYGSTQNNMVGGLEPGDANVIAGNDYHGVWLYGANTNQNTVLGNLIGVGANGTAMLGNLVDGVRIESDASQNTIGPGNVIAANQSDGVRVHEAASIDNLITQNSIYSNTIGISLTDGANGGIGAPVISSLTAVASGYQVSGTACSSCTVELFRNSDADGEGETYLTSGVAEPGGAFNIVVSPHLLMDGAYLTATSTAAGDGTSEFSSAFGYDLTFVMLPIVMR